MQTIVTMAGLKETIETISALPKKGKRAARQAMNRGLTVVVRGIKGKIGNRAKTKGHSLTRIRRAIGRRVSDGRTPHTLRGKVGFGVGKRRGSYPPHGLFKLWGTKDRYTGAVKKRYRPFGVKSSFEKSTGKARRYRGRVPEGTFIEEGFASSSAEAAKVMEAVAANAILREAIPSPGTDFDPDSD